jgi:hypothetical protein
MSAVRLLRAAPAEQLGGRGLAPGAALRAALSDFYQHSWRLMFLNTVLSLVAIAVVLTALWVPLTVVLALVVGPLAATLMHCAVALAQNEDLRLRDAVAGLRMHWRRGLALGLVSGGVTAAGIVALVFYWGSGPLGLPLAIVVLYMLGLFWLFQLVLWPLAVFEPTAPLSAVLRRAVLGFFARPLETILLAVVLLAVNLAGLAAALLPFLTLTIAYSFLAAAHFALPPSPLREAHS